MVEKVQGTKPRVKTADVTPEIATEQWNRLLGFVIHVGLSRGCIILPLPHGVVYFVDPSLTRFPRRFRRRMAKKRSRQAGGRDSKRAREYVACPSLQ